MTRLLTTLTGKLPIGWMQLMHNRTRLIAAVGGVTFANVLIFMQLGFMNALFDSSVQSHHMFDADVIVAASDFKALREANTVPRSRMLQALGVDGVVDAAPVYLGTMYWTDDRTGDTTNFRVIGVDPTSRVFVDESLQLQVAALAEPDTALVDIRTRDFDTAIAEAIATGGTFRIEAQGRTIDLRGTFEQGASFDVDGSLIVSDQTFLRLFKKRRPGTPTLALLHIETPTDVASVTASINAVLPEGDTKVWAKTDFINDEKSYQARQTPIGFVFGFGVAIGLLVGLVIVYQVLTTDVQDHLAEYATFKAIGYAPGFFRRLILEEAISLAGLGFVPGIVISMTLYHIAATATALPIGMTWTRPLLVFGLTAAMCLLSGLIATRRLNAADPADLF